MLNWMGWNASWLGWGTAAPMPPPPSPPDHMTVGGFPRRLHLPPPRDVYLERALAEDHLMVEFIATDDEDDGRTWQ